MSQNINLEKEQNVSKDNEIDLDKDFVIDNSLKINSNSSDTKKSNNLKNKSVDIDNMFERANNNVKEVTNIFQKNLILKQQLEEKIKKLSVEKEAFEKQKMLEYEKIK